MNQTFHMSRGCMILLLIAYCSTSYSQEIGTNSVISPSPSVAGTARYSEHPVDQSTGVPQIAIPLHTIQSTKLSYPITLSYHASGIRVNDISGPVGLGWTLSGGGVISRIMRGRPDEKPDGFFQYAATVPNATDNIPAQNKDNLATRAWDMMPDLFYYNTGTMAGKILFNNQLQPRCVPHNSLKIVPSSTSTLSTFTITDPGGISYRFDPGETATATIPGIGSQVSYISSWYLSHIVSADKLDTIRFNYSLVSSAYSYTTGETSGLAFYYNVPVGASKGNNEMNPLSSNVTVTVTGTRYLSSINFKGGKVDFIFNGGRTDDTSGRKLDEMIVYTKDPVNGSFVQDKKVVFAYSYFINTDGSTRLRLDNFREQLNPTTFNPPYTFTYSTKKLPQVGSPAQDHWGYYNGALLNDNLIPAYTTQGGTELSTANRNINSTYVDGFMLKTIVSPLNSVTEFVFEPNQYLNGTTNFTGPGLRINKIIVRDPFSPINSVTNYEYLNPTTGKSSGTLLNTPDYFSILDVVDMHQGTLKNYLCLLIQVNGTSVGNFSGAPLIYEYVTVYKNNDVNTAGKTVSKYSVYTAPVNIFPYFPVDDISWTAGDLQRQEVYKVVGGVSTLVKVIENNYSVASSFSTSKGLIAARKKIFFYSFPGDNDFHIKNYNTDSKFSFLSETKVYDYEQNSNTISNVTTINNYFDRSNVHLFPTKVNKSTSVSTETASMEFKYPQDYTATGVIGVMQNLNIVAQPLETKNILIKGASSVITGYSKIDYFEWATNRVYPRDFFTGKIPGSLSPTTFDLNPSNYRQQYAKVNSYDKTGTPVETETIGDRPQSVIIDEKLNRVVASVSPASANQIAFTSFESSDLGSWKMNTGVVTTTKNVALSLSNTYTAITLQTAQTISYSYVATRGTGPTPMLVFTKAGASPVNGLLSNSSGTGSVSLSVGTWNVELVYDFNVTFLTANFSYQQVLPAPANIVATQSKTGAKSLLFTSTQQVLIDNLPSGTYSLVYYQYGGSITVTPLNGAVITNISTSTAEADGWQKVEKEITITGSTQGVQLSGTSYYLDELRLYPKGSMMTSTCYDIYKNTITQTDVNLRSQFTEYDERRRVKIIRDHDKNILQQYDYTLAIN